MNRWIAGLLVTAVAAAVIAGAVTAAPAGPPIGQTGTNATGANGTTDLSPGERLAGVVGVQSAEIEGEVESRAFEVALRRSENPRVRQRAAEMLGRITGVVVTEVEPDRRIRIEYDREQIQKAELRGMLALIGAQKSGPEERMLE